MKRTDHPAEFLYGVDRGVWEYAFPLSLSQGRSVYAAVAGAPVSRLALAAALSPEYLHDIGHGILVDSLEDAVSLATAAGFSDPERRVKSVLRAMVHDMSGGYTAVTKLFEFDARLGSWCGINVAMAAFGLVGKDNPEWRGTAEAIKSARDQFTDNRVSIEKETKLRRDLAMATYKELVITPSYVKDPRERQAAAFACASAYSALHVEYGRRSNSPDIIASPAESGFYFQRAYASLKGDLYNPLFLQEGNEVARSVVVDAIGAYPLREVGSSGLARPSSGNMLAAAAGAVVGAAAVAVARVRR